MSILAFFAYEGKGEITVTKRTAIKKITNPGALYSQQRVMVYHPENVTFTTAEITEISKFINKLDRQNEHKPTD